MTILSIDQSLANTGYSVFDDHRLINFGVIETKPEGKKRRINQMDDYCRRILEINGELEKLIMYHRASFVIVEDYNGATKSKRAAEALATARAIVTLLAHYNKLHRISIPAQDAKKVVTGKRLGSKKEILDTLILKYPMIGELRSKTAESGWSGKAEHVGDSIALYEAAKPQLLPFM